MDRDGPITLLMCSVGIFAVGMELYRHLDPIWVLLWIFAAFWLGYIIGRVDRNGS